MPAPRLADLQFDPLRLASIESEGVSEAGVHALGLDALPAPTANETRMDVVPQVRLGAQDHGRGRRPLRSGSNMCVGTGPIRHSASKATRPAWKRPSGRRTPLMLRRLLTGAERFPSRIFLIT